MADDENDHRCNGNFKVDEEQYAQLCAFVHSIAPEDADPREIVREIMGILNMELE